MAVAVVAFGVTAARTAASGGKSARASAIAPKPSVPAESALQWSVPKSYRATILRRRVRYFQPKLLALTFDDGPDPKVTPHILAALAKYGAHATFFMVGEQAAKYPDLVAQVAAAGNAIGSHSYTHPMHESDGQAKLELTKTAEVISRVTGHDPVLFRPPYGLTKSPLSLEALARRYTLVLWTVSSADSRPIPPDVIANNVIHTPNPGDIVIMHDGPGHEATARALPEILKQLTAAGYRFVTIPDLLRAWQAGQEKGAGRVSRAQHHHTRHLDAHRSATHHVSARG